MPACLILLCLATLLASCSRSTGDFGRPNPSFVHDRAAPKLGKSFAKLRKETVSSFARTDDELRLEDAVWALIRPVHTQDWISAALIEGRRTRIFPQINQKLDHRAYLYWHRKQRFNSSEARWNRIITDIKADQAAVQPFYDQARLIAAIDEQRLDFLADMQGIEPVYKTNTKARISENEQLIQLAFDGLEHRFRAYEFAITRMILEFPSPRAQIAQDELHLYKKIIERGGQRGQALFPRNQMIPSRIGAGAKSKKRERADDKGVLK